jgi:hypothetical protein
MRCPLRLVPLAIALLSSPLVLMGYREGPLPAMTGGFGESTCLMCHFDNPANDDAGSLRLDGVPDVYIPGKEYAVTVHLRRPDIKRGGFEIAARFGDGPFKGQQAGRWRGTEGATQIVLAPGSEVQYVQHTKSGSDLTPAGEGRWTLHWTAPPASSAAVCFNVAANAANDDASPLGDYIYTASHAARPGSPRPAP